MPHPPLAVPEVGGGKESGIINTTAAMDEVASEIARIKPDVIIYITPHGTMYGNYFHIAPGDCAAGDFARFGVADVRLETAYDTAFVAELSRTAMEKGIPAGTQGDNSPLDHGVTVPMYYINRQYDAYKTVSISQSGLDVNMHFNLGKCIAAVAKTLGRKAVVIASGDLSHKLSDSGLYDYAPEGAVFDQDIMKYMREWNVNAICTMDNESRQKAAECGYCSIVMLAGCLDGMNVSAQQLSYEGPFGVGYGVVGFTPISENHIDPYRSLARKSIEHWVRTGQTIRLTPSEIENLPTAMRTHEAGVFVSLHKDGVLRGCIGTISPTTDCIAAEIIQNAISAASRDPRFNPIEETELPSLVYKVDILEAPEDITSPSQLDVKQYGVIVESGFKRGLLLPNLDGIHSVDQQIAIAMQKAGISSEEAITLKRFKVTRYE